MPIFITVGGWVMLVYGLPLLSFLECNGWTVYHNETLASLKPLLLQHVEMQTEDGSYQHCLRTLFFVRGSCSCLSTFQFENRTPQQHFG